MIEITLKLKERFCKDCNVPIRIFDEPYFMERIRLYDKFYGTVEKWNIFVEELQKYSNEQQYFEEYNRVKDTAINDIKASEGYQNFNQLDMNRCSVKHAGLPSKDIFHPSNDGRIFISVDMKKANFSALHRYDPGIFDYADTWEGFIRKYTDNKHIIVSKYIRQVILGNCNPKRHITYEKFLMDKVIDEITDIIPKERIVFFSNDEIVYDMTDAVVSLNVLEIIQETIAEQLEDCLIPLKVEGFLLKKIKGTSGYCKYFKDGSVEFKSLDNYMLPFVIRAFLNEEVQENDKVFIHEGKLSKYIQVPKIEVK